jgi:hypothetical protein
MKLSAIGIHRRSVFGTRAEVEREALRAELRASGDYGSAQQNAS